VGAGAGLLLILATGALLVGGTLAFALTRAVGDTPAADRDAAEAADVELVRCGEAQGRMTARIRVTNHSSAPSDYYVDVTFVRGVAAAPIETATAVVEDLAPGRTQAIGVGTAAQAPRFFDCRVGDVDRLEG
jgi:predicted secreted protein